MVNCNVLYQHVWPQHVIKFNIWIFFLYAHAQLLLWVFHTCYKPISSDNHQQCGYNDLVFKGR